MFVSEEKKKRYLSKIQIEMQRRGFTLEEIPAVISNTGFMMAFDNYPEEQLHYDVSDAVNEILLTAAKRKL